MNRQRGRAREAQRGKRYGKLSQLPRQLTDIERWAKLKKHTQKVQKVNEVPIRLRLKESKKNAIDLSTHFSPAHLHSLMSCSPA